MVGKKFLLVFFIFVFLFAITFVSAGECALYGGDFFPGDNTSCLSKGCSWATPATDPYCGNSDGCCFMDFGAGCFDFDGTSQNFCENVSLNGGLNCTWDSFQTDTLPNGTVISGLCFDVFSGDWGGIDGACWNHDADKATCTNQENSQNCNWVENDQNQNPWCGVKSLNDALMKNPFATLSDVGCCDMISCESYNGNENSCVNSTKLSGLCSWTSKLQDPYCPDGVGCCQTKWCGEVTDETNCTKLKTQLYMPCEWNAGACQDVGGDGGFGFFNDTDSCFDSGGWYNQSGSCVMPTGDFSGGAGGFMFGGESHCWFADNQPVVCGNITGCTYCVLGNGPNGVSNSSSNNICYNKPENLCEGHDTSDPNGNSYANVDNSANLNCSVIKIKGACNFGPLPNCVWTNSSAIVGSFCSVGTSSEKKSSPPVQFCEDPASKNNYTLCMDLAQNYMMPCKWDNSSLIVKNCTFNQNAVFGSGNNKDLTLINSESSCTAAGGTWQTENYVDGGILKQDSWCENDGFFDIATGQGQANKMNCDTSCWACEFQSNGSRWDSNNSAALECTSSALGYCKWFDDSSAFNSQGRCDYPSEVSVGGAGDCDSKCEDCSFMNDPENACKASLANEGKGCNWVNDPAKGSGYCVDKTKKICENDCFSCFDAPACDSSPLSCTWDSGLCSPQGFTGEICFDGIDNDNDKMVDCSDPDCAFDNFCGGASFGGDCFQPSDQASCVSTIAFDNLNCTWVNDTWEPVGHCDMPGSNCWQFDNNLTSCGLQPGCTNQSSFVGAVCDLNSTKTENANCFSDDYSACLVSSECTWMNDSYDSSKGWCEYSPIAQCKNLSDSSSCSLNSNCTWNQDQYSEKGGWCDVACFSSGITDGLSCSSAGSLGLCEWKDMSNTCQPENFMMLGSSQGGKSGCGQYDGNESACNLNNITCVFQTDLFYDNDSFGMPDKGWCMDKAEFQQFGDLKGDVIDLAKDSGNSGIDSPEAGVSGVVDLTGLGMRSTDDAFNFGANVYSINESIMCNGYMVSSGFGSQKTLGVGNSPTSFYWYLDTDGKSTGGCNAVGGDFNETGYEFMLSYVSRNTSSGIVETKQLMRCSSGDSWTATNTLVTTSKKMSCGEIPGVMVAIDKQGLETFSEYNKSAVMKIFMSSANGSDSRLNPSDYVGPGYYTQGSIDFGFVDCSNPEVKDPKCKNVQKFGFNIYEECMNGVDDDENGLTDCDDPMCSFNPKCNGGDGFNFVVDENDKSAPTVTFNKVEALSDGAFFRTDTNEPSNLSLQFYFNDSSCLTLNKTLADSGAGFLANANFKPFHSVDLIQDNLGYSLINGTTYYYKLKLCDPSSNCGVSACSNFTTEKSLTQKDFIFKMDLDDGFSVDIPAFNKTDYNFTEEFGGVYYDVGIKTNTSVTKDFNFTVNCGNMSIGFFGVNILEPTKIDLTGAFICDSADNLIGMNSTLKKWNKLLEDLHLGGAVDFVRITIPVAYNSSNTLNWTNDEGTEGQNVNGYVNCTGNSTSTVCDVPVSMGFSAYTISVPSTTTTTTTTTSSGGGGGGGAIGSSSFWNVTYASDDKELSEKGVVVKSLSVGGRMRLKVNSEKHYVGVVEISGSSAKINISSDSQQILLSVGESKNVEVDGDNYYDLKVTLNSITGLFANVSVGYIHEKFEVNLKGNSSSSPLTGEATKGGSGDVKNPGLNPQSNSFFGLLVFGVLIAVLIIFGLIVVLVKKNNASKNVVLKKKKQK